MSQIVKKRKANQIPVERKEYEDVEVAPSAYDVVPTMPNIFNLKNKFGFPRSIITKLRYADVKTLSGTSGAVGSHFWALNALYDPDSTGIGHQPLYYDELAAIYNYYSVQGCILKFKIQNIVDVPTVVCILKDDNASIGGLTTCMETTDAVHHLLGGKGQSNDYIEIFTTYSSTVDASTSVQDRSLASVGGLPTELMFAPLVIRSADGSSTASIIYTVEMQFTCRFEDLKTITGS